VCATESDDDDVKELDDEGKEDEIDEPKDEENAGEIDEPIDKENADEIDEPKDKENEIVPSPTVPLDASPQLRPLDTSKEEDTPVIAREKKNQVAAKRGCKRKLLPSIGDENDLANLNVDGDNSFDVIPTTSTI
jgi:hypothetical protein